MPLIPSAYTSNPFLLFNGHLQTIVPNLTRKISDVRYERERIETPDADFIDLDWSRVGGKVLTVLSHGLEGNSHRPYILGMVKALNKAGSDALAWNFRSCSGENNRLLRSYHMGATDDLDLVLRHALASEAYKAVNLVGFSMGGNLTLLYLGQNPERVPAVVRRTAVFSVPCNLKTDTRQMARRANGVYMKRFLRSLEIKLRQKDLALPGQLNLTGYHSLRTFQEFDDRYTAPLHGFGSADEYYERCSARQFLTRIQIPTLLVNAQNDPFLSAESFPVREAEQNPNFYLEMPAHGGHVGFVSSFWGDRYYTEERAIDFLFDDINPR